MTAAIPDALDAALAHHRAGRHAQAEALLLQALQRDPEQPQAWNFLGVTLAAQRRHRDAERAYREALKRRAGDPDALNNLAVLLRQTGRADQARDAYLEALRADPRHTDAWNNLGALHTARHAHREALQCYLNLLEIDPDYGHALGAAAHAMATLCDWERRAEMVARLADGVRAGKPVAAPFVLLSQLDDPQLQLACARRWSGALQARATLPAPPPYRHDRLRIAYLSADFREHPVGLQIAALIERHDRRAVECFGIHFGAPAPQDATHRRLRLAFDSFLDVARLPDDEVARRLRALEIDIAVDLAGHTLDARPGILALRPAPIQVSWLGYPGSSGASWIDYLIGDRFLVPAAQRSGVSERIVHLPQTFWVGDIEAEAGPPPSRESIGLPADGFVFCCFNHPFKLNPTMFELWLDLLREIPGSVLWLLAPDDEPRRNLRAHAERHGVAPDRLVFAGRVGLHEHRARHACADLFLDTLPFNAITTTSTALHAGLPVLTCAGRSFAARGAGSLLHAVGLDSLVTGGLDAYRARALELAARPERLAELRAMLARRRAAGPLFDPEPFRRHLEAAFRAIVTRHERGDPPVDIVPAPSR